jgi:membrane protease YdiL (CAAX protease family)
VPSAPSDGWRYKGADHLYLAVISAFGQARGSARLEYRASRRLGVDEVRLTRERYRSRLLGWITSPTSIPLALKKRVRPAPKGWYAVALLTAPLLVTAVLLVLSLSSPEYLPTILTTSDKAALLLTGIVGSLGAGIFEELGWTGFATPTLLRLRHGVLATGLIVGALWGVAHFPLYYWASGNLSGALSPALLVAAQVLAWFPAYRVLMVWVYERTESLLLAMLMHVSLTLA